MDRNDTLEDFLETILGNKRSDYTDQVLNDFRQHVEDIVKNPSKCENELEKQLAAATNDYLTAVNERSDCKNEKLNSAQNHLDSISEIIDFYHLYIDLIEGLQSEIESERKKNE